MIFDTDILVWYFRGNNKAKKILQDTTGVKVSAVTLMELIQGVKSKQELYMLNKFLQINRIHIYYLNEEITIHAIHLLEEYTLSDGVEWGDALIAATSLHYGEDILTANIKHYRCFSNLKLVKFTPQ